MSGYRTPACALPRQRHRRYCRYLICVDSLALSTSGHAAGVSHGVIAPTSAMADNQAMIDENRRNVKLNDITPFSPASADTCEYVTPTLMPRCQLDHRHHMISQRITGADNDVAESINSRRKMMLDASLAAGVRRQREQRANTLRIGLVTF